MSNIKPMERIAPELGIRRVFNTYGEFKGIQQAWKITPQVNNLDGKSTIEWRNVPVVVIDDMVITGTPSTLGEINFVNS